MDIKTILDALNCNAHITVVLDNGSEQGWRMEDGTVQFCNGGGEWVEAKKFTALRNLVSIAKEWDNETHLIEWILPTEDEFWYVPF